MEFSVEKVLSGIKRNIYGNIISANAATMLWLLHKKSEVKFSFTKVIFNLKAPIMTAADDIHKYFFIVLMVSYCDQSLSVVRHPCIVNFLL